MLNSVRWRVVSDPRFIAGVTLLGGFVYLIQSVIYAHTQFSLLDEGAYLNKGYLYVTGKYQLYQDNGPWANHMPLAFLIPGYVQALFGPGLRVGRYMAIFLGMCSLLGLWILARRLGGKGWGALVIWTLALNPAIIKLYSLANSQVLVASILVWVLVLTVGEDRPLWQLLSGSALAGILLLTRINMAPVLGMLILYLIWLRGWRIGLSMGFLIGLVVVIGHILYWPGILRIWAHWLPVDVFTFLQPWGHPPGSAPSWRPTVTLSMRVTSFFHGLRFHFLASIGALSAWLLWPSRGQWKSSGRYKTAIFLSATLIVMFLAHMWASLGQSYCVFCFPVYLSFFSWIGLLLLTVTFVAGKPLALRLPTWVTVIILLSTITGVGFSAHADLGNILISGDFVRSVLAIEVPRIRGLQIQPGSVEVWGLLANSFGLTYVQVVQQSKLILQMLVTAALGLFLGLGIGLITWLIRRRQAVPRGLDHYGSLALGLLLVLGLIMSPTTILGGGFKTYDCGGDVIQRYEAVGAYLAENIPPGSSVYWDGGDSTVPLLYLESVHIYPAQLNGDYSLRLGGDADALVRYGFWSQELAQRWAQEADIILIASQNYNGWLRDLVESGGYDELPPTPSLLNCHRNSEIHIFKKETSGVFKIDIFSQRLDFENILRL